MSFIKKSLLCVLLFAPFYVQAKEGNCHLEYRPKSNELAFVAKGSPLKTADEVCSSLYLSIPYTQHKKAVTLEKGKYRLLRQDRHTMYFALSENKERSKKDKEHRAEITSCLLCDPLKSLEVDLSYQDILCVRSALGIRSCAINNKAIFSIEEKFYTYENICVKSLIYQGVDNDILRFGYNSCDSNDNINQNVLEFNLKENNIINFQDFTFIVEKASDKGLVYRLLESQYE